MKKIILLDVDGTLIDYRRLYKLSSLFLIKNVFSFNSYKNIVAILLLMIKQKPYLYQNKFRGTFLDPKFYENSLYPDVLPTLISFKDKGYTIGIWSQANIKKQMLKLSFSGALKYLDSNYIFISKDKRAELTNIIHLTTNTNLFLVDDRLDMANTLKENDLKYFLIDRQDKIRATETHHIIKKLSETIALIP